MCDRDAGRRFASDECRKRDERPGRPRGPSRPQKRGSLTCAGEGEEIASFSSGVRSSVFALLSFWVRGNEIFGWEIKSRY